MSTRFKLSQSALLASFHCCLLVLNSSLFAQCPVFAEIAPPGFLDCYNPVLTLDGSNSSTGPDIEYTWSFLPAPNGAMPGISEGADTPTPQVNQPGEYILTVTDTVYGCTATASVMVEADLLQPTAVSNAAGLLSCTYPTVTLSGNGSSTGPEFLYQWQAISGNILSGHNTLNDCVVDSLGFYSLTVTNIQNGCTAVAVVSVGSNMTVPVVVAALPPAINCADTTLTLSGEGSSAGSNYTYFWTTVNGNITSGATTLFPDVNAAGEYVLTVTHSATGCTASDTLMVTSNALPAIARAGLPVVLGCNPPSQNLDASQSGTGPWFAYQWVGPGILSGDTTLFPEVNAPGKYFLTVTNTANGCTAVDSVSVVEDITSPIASATVAGELNCQTAELALDGTASSSGAGFSFSWTTTAGGNFVSSQNTLTPLVDAPGVYTLTLLNQTNGCTASATVAVTSDTTAPVAGILPGGEISCLQAVVTLDGSSSSAGVGIGYLWTTTDGNIISGQTTSSSQVDAPGQYTLTITDLQNGCTAQATVAVIGNLSVPQVGIELPGLLTCKDTVLVLDASASSTGSDFLYQWTTLNGSISGSSTLLSPTVASPGDYTLQVTNQLNGCSATATATVFQNTTPPGADAGPDMAITCKEMQIALAGSSPTLNTTFSWTTQDGHFLFDTNTTMPGVDAPGTYTLVVTDPMNGCTSADQTLVTTELPEDFNFEKEDPFCEGDKGSILFTEVLGGTKPFRYSIDGGISYSELPLFENLEPGGYSLAVQDAGGCKLSKEVELSPLYEIVLTLEPEVTISLGESYSLNPQTSIPLADLAEISWTPAVGLDCTDCLRTAAQPAENTSYTLEIADQHGCQASATILIKVLRTMDIYVPNAFSPDGDGINDVFLLFSKPRLVSNVVSLKIFTRWGELVFSADNFHPQDPAYGWDGTAGGKPLDAGTYTWLAVVELLNNERVTLRGDVALIR